MTRSLRFLWLDGVWMGGCQGRDGPGQCERGDDPVGVPECIVQTCPGGTRGGERGGDRGDADRAAEVAHRLQQAGGGPRRVVGYPGQSTELDGGCCESAGG